MQPLAFKSEWNINTVFIALSIAGVVVTGITAWNNQQTQNVIQNDWIAKAEKDTAVWREQARIRDSANDVRAAAQETNYNKLDAEVDRLSDRVAGTEKSIEEMGDRFDRMIDAITQVRDNGNELNTKLEILRTILERIENMRMKEQGDRTTSGSGT